MYGNSEYIIGKLNKDFDLDKKLFLPPKFGLMDKKMEKNKLKIHLI